MSSFNKGKENPSFLDIINKKVLIIHKGSIVTELEKFSVSYIKSL